MQCGRHKAETDKATRRVVWMLAGTMVLSFILGIVAFLPEEHRAAKLEETMAKYQAKGNRP
ncbi:MAG: hypothetical protein GY949_14395 [Gammaproteobacteria bacterium]|nr:hypothetical protein [Gammaproteobacteria bacterium]